MAFLRWQNFGHLIFLQSYTQLLLHPHSHLDYSPGLEVAPIFAQLLRIMSALRHRISKLFNPSEDSGAESTASTR